jgi:hypothetical protein
VRDGANAENITEFLTPSAEGPAPGKLLVYFQVKIGG